MNTKIIGHIKYNFNNFSSSPQINFRLRSALTNNPTTPPPHTHTQIYIHTHTNTLTHTHAHSHILIHSHTHTLNRS